jgi:hypothetical protein
LIFAIENGKPIVRTAARRDANERAIIKAMEAEGAFVRQINDEGRFDLLVWHKGQTLLMEVKDGSKPPSARRLSDAEQKFHDEWPGDNLHVVNSDAEAIVILRACG